MRPLRSRFPSPHPPGRPCHACGLRACATNLTHHHPAVCDDRTLTDKQRELMEQFAEEEEKHPKAGFLKETIDRIKQYIKG